MLDHMEEIEAARANGTASPQNPSPYGESSATIIPQVVKLNEAREALQDLVADMLAVPERGQHYFERAGRRLECTSCAYVSVDPEADTCPNCDTWLVSPNRAAVARQRREAVIR